MTKDEEIFKGKTFSDLMSDIYSNQKKKDRQIKLLIAQLEPMVKSLDQAAVVVPLIKEYLDISVKNDDALIKMAGIVQRAMNSASNEGGDLLTEKEKEMLFQSLQDLNPND